MWSCSPGHTCAAMCSTSPVLVGTNPGSHKTYMCVGMGNPSQTMPGYSNTLPNSLAGKVHQAFNISCFFHAQEDLFHSISRVIARWIQPLRGLQSDTVSLYSCRHTVPWGQLLPRETHPTNLQKSLCNKDLWPEGNPPAAGRGGVAGPQVMLQGHTPRPSWKCAHSWGKV